MAGDAKTSSVSSSVVAFVDPSLRVAIVPPRYVTHAGVGTVPSSKRQASAHVVGALARSPFSAALAFIAVTVGCRVSGRSAVCRTAKGGTKKKGTRVVDGRSIPWNVWTVRAPFEAEVVENVVHAPTLTKRTGDPNWETCHITLSHNGAFPFVEGQSLGVIAPGPDKNGKSPAKIRLYSISSSAAGDDETSTTVSLCVKRLVEVKGKNCNREIGEDQPDASGTCFPDAKVYRGVSSNFVCDLRPGDRVQLTGPTGAEMLLPDDNEANYIFLATGTGIAPMRSYLRLLFHDEAGAINGSAERRFKGSAWLFLGVPYEASLLYDAEHRDYAEKFPSQFRYDYAISREQRDAVGQKMYIHNKMAEYGEELWDLMQSPKTHVFVCGLKGMMKGMDDLFAPFATKDDKDWSSFFKQMKKDGRMHVEVY
eukprot:TRINITY_DN41815_c0_g1_i1.p1 TRINITY_DN41815_c0_g1~~TRINITY_DN41815_c0_g1_i1.p1  ORF type:complete len:481 (-),score=69.99 TRINITY_DN41815_c0_g1_i1:100-1368(-)